VKLAMAAAHFHGFGVARQGPWVTSVNKGKRERRGLLGTLEALGALEDWRAFLACTAPGRTNRALQLFLYRREN
jgi:hypothetical protein